jgi:hypothetical protein
LASLPGEMLLPLLGAWWGGAVGFALGFAAARVVTATVWWRAFLLHGVPASAQEAVAPSSTPARPQDAVPGSLAVVGPNDGD